MKKEWLNDSHISTVNKLTISANFSVNGHQETILAQYCNKTNHGFTPLMVFKPREYPSVNYTIIIVIIWFALSILKMVIVVYLLDSSLGNNVEKCLTDSLKIQWAQMYGQAKMIKIIIPQEQQQNNGHDYGLFATANMMELVTCRYSGLKEQKLAIFLHSIRNVQTVCQILGTELYGTIPKKSLDSPININVVTVDMDLFCCCNIPVIPGLGPWIACDPQKCECVTGKRIFKTYIYICKKCHKTLNQIFQWLV